MFYDIKKNNHGLKYNPFKSCIIPRPIAWITTISSDGIDNCAPYSFFNGVASDPPMVMFANNGPSPYKKGPKDTFSNIKYNKEFVVNISTYESKDKMNKERKKVEMIQRKIIITQKMLEQEIVGLLKKRAKGKTC